VTNILTGVSGITSLSPALSAADGRLVFSAYEDDGYNIYAMDSERAAIATEPIQLPLNAGVLPPRREGAGPVYAALQNETAGLPAVAPIEPEPYKSGLALDYAGQPMFGVGTDPFGTYAAGGVSFLFSDTLGNHVLATSVQVTNRFDEFGGQLFYLNRTHRWNWGVGVDQTPYISSAFATGFRYRQRPERLYRARIPHQADRSWLLRIDFVSVQCGQARGVLWSSASTHARRGRDRSDV
jgi:hypothetical protein